MTLLDLRRQLLSSRGARGAILEELLDSNQAPHPAAMRADSPTFPLPDEPHLDAWRRYAEEAAQSGVWRALQEHFIQLQFPIRDGISKEDRYLEATRKGISPAPGETDSVLELAEADGLELLLHPSISGTVPILIPAQRGDFVALVRAFTARNEPRVVPDSMGACLVAGLNNWDRIRAYRSAWEAEDPAAHTSQVWIEEFRRLIPHKELYQDRFIILSRGPYSGVSAEDVKTDPAQWLDHSLQIRREHECAHYFTLRVFGKLGQNVLEELLADLVGIVRTYKKFDADLALCFLGLEQYPVYRPGGRLENYRGTLSDKAFAILQELTHDAVRNLAQIGRSYGDRISEIRHLAELVFALTPTSLEELADASAVSRWAKG